MDAKALAVIENLLHYNVIMGMAEHLAQSMTILRHVLVSDRFSDDNQQEYIGKVFDKYNIKVDQDEKLSNKINVSMRDGVSTELVLQQLEKDVDFMLIFQEYVKYEQLIHDFAWEMHMMQFLEATTITSREK